MATTTKDSKKWAFPKRLLGLMLSVGLVFAWVFVVFLSNALYAGNDSVSSATLFTAVCTIATFVVGVLVLVPFDLKRLMGKKPLLFLSGLGCLLVASLLLLFPSFQGLQSDLSPVIVGVVTGAGLSFVVLSLLVQASNLSFADVVTCYMGSLAFGIIFFVIYAAVLPQNLAAKVLWVFPLLAGVASFVAHKVSPLKNEVSSTYIRSLAKSQLRAMFENSGFIYFILVGGFLFGYCYAIFPKSTQFAGTYSEILFGLVSPAVIVFLAAAFLIIVFLVVVSRLAHRNSAYIFGCVLLVALATMYFSFPYMPNNWMLFVLLGSAALSTVLFICAGAILRCSAGDKRGFVKCVVMLLASIAAGAFMGALFIETTVPDPIIVVPEYLRDAVIVGTPAIGFIILVSIFFIMARNMFFPAAVERQGAISGSPDLASANRVLAERFSLTPREEEIMGMLLQGRSGPYISEDLYLSKSTVKTHIRHIYDKTGVSSRQQLIDLAHSVENPARQ